ncbi:helix-turn-helix transcriptional regulator [Sporosarcina sp. FSL K6-1540]|uniref:helix-turn-helix domain-containing protein n=1 Tax=Sporosarcina sp. FSL K6-1540 TaxID=2921555 RepID=UPI00315AA3CF
MKFGKVIRQARLNAGFSQEEIADLMFMPRSKISKLENDKVELKVADFIRWLQVTQLHEVTAATAAIVCGVDLVALTQMLTTLVGGIISFLF